MYKEKGYKDESFFFIKLRAYMSHITFNEIVYKQLMSIRLFDQLLHRKNF
jgi:hypothetical protein